MQKKKERKKEKKIKAELTLGTLVFSLVLAQGLGARGHSVPAHWIATERGVTGLHSVLCNSYLPQPAIPLLFCASQSSGYTNTFLHLSLFPKCLTWFIAQINLYLTSLTHVERSTSSQADVNKAEGGHRHCIICQETSTDIVKNFYANWLNKSMNKSICCNHFQAMLWKKM